ncbi:helix-turn-helix transcriptional regulator [Solihabitans fulvus]|uniref:Helix-turn-helix transcriptional regulator n=1 Tax=Solihabitans fulvus TaxID=1892852 RepID=A0A5B2X695_9PSEU|nr:TetR/AcrR family transcriptional regulator [Solihabitans fulvus]KAA2258715.1 helix-turn-helix transcriptional regulator [Solihabitans fulvus]
MAGRSSTDRPPPRANGHQANLGRIPVAEVVLGAVAPVSAEQPRQERADAARNRARVLEAAEKLFADGNAKDVTMEDIARAAGVGRATLYRRYPDPTSIAQALLDEHERELQERILTGVPPLGPGATPPERLAAFYRAMIELLERHLHLALGAETGRARFRTGVYGFWRTHIRVLLDAAGVPGTAPLLDMLLAPLAPELYEFQRHNQGMSVEEIAEGLSWLAFRTLGWTTPDYPPDNLAPPDPRAGT